MELISLKDMPFEAKEMLLKEIGYTTDGIYVLNNTGQRVKDRYTDDTIRLDNMLIFPGSVIILDNNPLSIIEYLEEYGESF